MSLARWFEARVTAVHVIQPMSRGGPVQADLIVMGARAATADRLGRLFLGSTANQVVRRAPCPVLVVRQK